MTTVRTWLYFGDVNCIGVITKILQTPLYTQATIISKFCLKTCGVFFQWYTLSLRERQGVVTNLFEVKVAGSYTVRKVRYYKLERHEATSATARSYRFRSLSLEANNEKTLASCSRSWYHVFLLAVYSECYWGINISGLFNLLIYVGSYVTVDGVIIFHLTQNLYEIF